MPEVQWSHRLNNLVRHFSCSKNRVSWRNRTNVYIKFVTKTKEKHELQQVFTELLSSFLTVVTAFQARLLDADAPCVSSLLDTCFKDSYSTKILFSHHFATTSVIGVNEPSILKCCFSHLGELDDYGDISSRSVFHGSLTRTSSYSSLWRTKVANRQSVSKIIFLKIVAQSLHRDLFLATYSLLLSLVGQRRPTFAWLQRTAVHKNKYASPRG